MGLFSSIIHVRERDQKAVCGALGRCVAKWGYADPVSSVLQGKPRDASPDCLLYLVSPRLVNWTTIVEAHGYSEDAPWLSELALALSANLDTHTLSLMVHDDDVLYYNLCRGGMDLDGYNSCPQYFEQDRLPDSTILEQRHDISHFEPLLPAEVSLSQLEGILNRGWWAAYLGGRLDKDGVTPPGELSYVFEGERMIDIGNLLQLYGSDSGYPFAGWADDSSDINWSTFLALTCHRTPE